MKSAEQNRDGDIAIADSVAGTWEAKEKDLHWDYLERKLKELGLAEFYHKIEKIARRWFSGTPDIRESKEETVLLLAGIYVLHRLFPGYHRMAAEYAFLKKVPVLLPVAWIMRIAHFLKTKQPVIRQEIETLKSNI